MTRMHSINVAASGDFLKPDGSPAYPGFDFTPLARNPSIKFRFLEARPSITPQQISDVDVLILSGARVTPESFHPNRRLGLIAQFGAGIDHIDLPAATANGVAVINTPTGVRRPMAVAIMTLILALVTKLHLQIGAARERAAMAGRGPPSLPASALPGRHSHRSASATSQRISSASCVRSRCSFIAYDPYADARGAMELGVELVSLDEVFARADILSVNCPLTKETRHLSMPRISR